MEKEPKFGSVTLDQLLDAFKVITDVIQFIQENRNSTDEDTRDTARIALMAVLFDDMAKRPIINTIVSEEVKTVIGKKGQNEANSSIEIPVRPAPEKS